MFRSLQDFFDALQPTAAQPAQDAEAVRLACAVLLVEVTREGGADAAERAVICDALRARFGLQGEDLRQLVGLAEQVARDASDFFQFTSRLNEALDTPAKIGVVEAMWREAYADGNPDAYEMHVISRIAGLLEVTHGEYIAAKLRAKEASGL
jgi:uncharacterized tellurite resistance protein B-like protein